MRSLAPLTIAHWVMLAASLPSLYAQQRDQPAGQGIEADILLKHGSLHVGDGEPAKQGDVAIKDGQIVAVGNFAVGGVKQTIDCTGLVISPGFIDLHNHSDDGVLKNATRAVSNYLTQGCTTIVTGNCGGGPIDIKAYYDKLDQLGVGTNIIHLIPQGDLRREVMESERRVAMPEELQQMLDLAEKAMQDGAWGMSTGLIYVPSSYADTSELAEIANVVGRYGGLYASHIRNEGTQLLDAVAEALDIGRRADVPVHISHFKSSGQDSWGLVRTAVEVVKEARAGGQVVTADQYPYTASSTSLSATCIPAWARAGGREKMLERIDTEGDESNQILDAIRHKLDITDDGHRLQISLFKPRPAWSGQRLDDIARAEGLSTLELLLKIEREGGASIVNHSINESDVRFVMQQPWVATASDGSSRIPSHEIPHPRSYGTFPRKIGFYAVAEQVVDLKQAIRSCCGLPADILGLEDRGYLKVGYAADIAVWSAGELLDTATFEQPHSYSQGVRYLFVNGTPAIYDSHLTGALAGQALRHQPNSAN